MVKHDRFVEATKTKGGGKGEPRSPLLVPLIIP